MKWPYKIGTNKAKSIASFLGIDWDEKWLGFELKPLKRHRSLDQNARYWAIVSALADYSGFTKAEMHEEILCEMHGYDLVTFRGSDRKRPKGRSSNLTTEDFNQLMGIAEGWAESMGVTWEAA